MKLNNSLKASARGNIFLVKSFVRNISEQMPSNALNMKSNFVKFFWTFVWNRGLKMIYCNQIWWKMIHSSLYPWYKMMLVVKKLSDGCCFCWVSERSSWLNSWSLSEEKQMLQSNYERWWLHQQLSETWQWLSFLVDIINQKLSLLSLEREIRFELLRIILKGWSVKVCTDFSCKIHCKFELKILLGFEGKFASLWSI